MTDELKEFITSVKVVGEIGKRHSGKTLSDKITLYHNLAYRRIDNIYYRETTDISNSLVVLLDLSKCIRQPYHRLITKEKDITWPLLNHSLENYAENWELALEQHKQDEKVQKLLARYSLLSQEMKRMIEYCTVTK